MSFRQYNEESITIPESNGEWKVVQKKTFTNWVNVKLRIGNYAAISDLYEDLTDGTKLIYLLEIIGNESLGKFVTSPKMRVQKMENLNTALNYIQSKNVRLTNIGAEDICDGYPKLILGLIWSIILRFTISNIEQEGLGAKEGLLLWCQKKTKDHKNVNIKDFTNSWKDGMVFSALIHKHHPDLIDYDHLDPKDQHNNVENAFKILEEKLGIPRLMDVEDVCDTAVPDERSVLTYVAQLYHAFNELEKIGNSERRLANFLNLMQSTNTAKNQYEVKARELVGRIQVVRKEMDLIDVQGLGIEEVRTKIKDPQFLIEKIGFYESQLDLIHLLNVIQTKLVTYKLPSYTPPSDITIPAINDLLSQFIKELQEYDTSLKSHYKMLKLNFYQKFNSSYDKIQEYKGEIENKLMEEMENLTEKTQDSSIQDNIDSAEGYINLLNALFEENQGTHIVSKVEAKFLQAKRELELLKLNYDAKTKFIENHLASSKSSLTESQLEDVENSFKHFDTNKSKMLDRVEFEACLTSMGHSYSPLEFDKLFDKVAEENEAISYQQYLAYMTELLEDKVNKNQIKNAFNAISKGENVLEVSELEKLNLEDGTLDYAKEAIPVKNGGLDFNSYLNQVFRS